MRKKNKLRRNEITIILCMALKNVLICAALGWIVWRLFSSMSANSEIGAFLRDGILR